MVTTLVGIVIRMAFVGGAVAIVKTTKGSGAER
jgi:hypothetical protein